MNGSSTAIVPYSGQPTKADPAVGEYTSVVAAALKKQSEQMDARMRALIKGKGLGKGGKPKKEGLNVQTKDKCGRCGRNNHKKEDCTATKHKQMATCCVD